MEGIAKVERFLYTFVLKMNVKTVKYYPLFFIFCILASLIASSYYNINIPVANSIYAFSKHSAYTSKEKTSTSNDFLFEENETKNETSLDFKLWSNLLVDLVSYFQFETAHHESLTSHLLVVKRTNPIYILYCDFRI